MAELAEKAQSTQVGITGKMYAKIPGCVLKNRNNSVAETVEENAFIRFIVAQNWERN